MQYSDRFLTLYSQSIKPGKSTRVKIGELPVANALIKLLREAYFVEDAIYVSFNPKMIKNNRLFGLHLKSISYGSKSSGQIIIQYNGVGSINNSSSTYRSDLLFSIETRGKNGQYEDVYTQTVNDEEAVEYLCKMMKLGKLYNACYAPIRLCDRNY